MIYFPHCPMVLAIYFGWRCLEVNYLNLHVHSVNKVYAVMKSWRDISFYGLHIMLSLYYNDYIQLENPVWFHIDSQKDKWPSIKALQKPVCASKRRIITSVGWLMSRVSNYSQARSIAFMETSSLPPNSNACEENAPRIEQPRIFSVKHRTAK